MGLKRGAKNTTIIISNGTRIQLSFNNKLTIYNSENYFESKKKYCVNLIVTFLLLKNATFFINKQHNDIFFKSSVIFVLDVCHFY